MNDGFTHLNSRGEARIVDVGDKATTRRRAVAEGWLTMTAETLTRLMSGDVPKGDALAVARVAGIMGAKRTSELVPLCHPIPLTHVEVTLEADRSRGAVHCRVTTETTDRTGVEMEALTGVQTALLALYDMCKALDRAMTVTDVRLVSKTGGKSGDWHREG
ncbi:MAG TPA: cyclic pyranopterin monophosphate synthase MoaC [Gammaproteobacteria bacterium]|nr:cyclic pyranopterin monophosphate synthase MoaC [Gammaproteobacteria bacterium]